MTPPKSERPTLIFIMSDVRSGSTLLEYMLASNDNVVSIGEAHHLKSYLVGGYSGKRWRHTCSCGVKLTECPFWTSVLSENTKKLVKEYSTSFERQKMSSLSLNPNYEKDEHFTQRIQLYSQLLQSLATSSKAVFVTDSSKREHQGLALYHHLPNDVKLIYLKRDLRAVVLSKLKWQNQIHARSSSVLAIVIGSLFHRFRQNRAFNKVKSRDKIAITYSDLCAHPQRTTQLIATTLDMGQLGAPRYFERSKSHTIGGTPDKREKQPIVYDDSWKQQLRHYPLLRLVGWALNKLT